MAVSPCVTPAKAIYHSEYDDSKTAERAGKVMVKMWHFMGHNCRSNQKKTLHSRSNCGHTTLSPGISSLCQQMQTQNTCGCYDPSMKLNFNFQITLLPDSRLVHLTCKAFCTKRSAACNLNNTLRQFRLFSCTIYMLTELLINF